MHNKLKIFMAVALLASAFVLGYMLSGCVHDCGTQNEVEPETPSVQTSVAQNEQYEKYYEPQDNQYTYPQEADFNRGISTEYTADILAKKSSGEALTSEEEDLIFYFKLQDSGYGLAYTRFREHDGGMGKATRRFWETSDGGANWNILREDIYSIGEYDYTYIDNIFIEASFGTTAEKGYFNISSDRGHSYTYIPYTDVFEYDGVAYAKKTAENASRKTVTYDWIDLYTKETVATVEYDFDMNVIK